ncbi:MAG: hypothetical protein AB8G17_02665 [Gammaproteobacteria bacterium]
MPKANASKTQRMAAVALAAAVFFLGGCEPSPEPPVAATVDSPVASAPVPTPTSAGKSAAFEPSRATSLALAELQAHVEAALYLQREGAPGQVAGAHLTRALTHHEAAQQAQFDLLGLDRARLRNLAEAMSAAATPSDLTSQITGLQAHLVELIDVALGNPLNQIRHLIDRIGVVYAAAVEGQAVVAPDTYYEALGYATVAFERSADIKGEAGDALRTELNELLNLWPGVNASAAPPATVEDLREQLNRVRDILRYTR